jgi:hypothetical protein
MRRILLPQHHSPADLRLAQRVARAFDSETLNVFLLQGSSDPAQLVIHQLAPPVDAVRPRGLFGGLGRLMRRLAR